MKVIVCSGLKLGGSGSSAYPARDFTSKVAAAVRETGAGAVFIAGDLFCDHLFNDDLYNTLYNCFSALSGTHFFVCPGPADPFVADSPYVQRDWPENVHTFKTRMKAFGIASPGDSGEPDVRVYGIGQGRHRRGVEVLSREKQPKIDRKFLNVLVLSAPPINDAGNIDFDFLKKCGFDAFIFGSTASDDLLDPHADNIALPPEMIVVPSGTDGIMCGSISKNSPVSPFEPVFPAALASLPGSGQDASAAPESNFEKLKAIDPGRAALYRRCENALEKTNNSEKKDKQIVDDAKLFLFRALSGGEIPEVTGK